MRMADNSGRSSLAHDQATTVTQAANVSHTAGRVRELSRLLPLWPDEIADESPGARRRLVAIMRRALRAERQRGIGGHWTYDLARHAQLLEAYRTELAALKDVERRRDG
jgi:hypothetical protein